MNEHLTWVHSAYLMPCSKVKYSVSNLPDLMIASFVTIAGSATFLELSTCLTRCEGEGCPSLWAVRGGEGAAPMGLEPDSQAGTTKSCSQHEMQASADSLP